MSTAPVATPYRTKLFINNGEFYFTIVECPGCNLKFRLLWPVTVSNYPRNSILHLKCPGAEHSFTSDQLAVGKIYHVRVGCKDYPAAPVASIVSPRAPQPTR